MPRISDDLILKAARRRHPLLSQYNEQAAGEAFMEARADLELILPAILSDLRRELLGDETVEAAARGWGRANIDVGVHFPVRPRMKIAIEAALDSLVIHEGDPSDA